MSQCKLVFILSSYLPQICHVSGQPIGGMIKIIWYIAALLVGAVTTLSVVEAATPRQTPRQTGNTALPAPSQLGAPQTFTSPDQIQRYMKEYRQRPEPKRLPELVQALSGMGVFREIESTGVYVGFMAGVLGANRDQAEALVKGMFPLPPEDQVAIIRAIAYSGLPDWKVLLETFIERMPARRVLIDRFLNGKTLPLDKLGMETGPLTLDTNWGYYFASGDFAPVRRIIGALAWVKEPNDLEKLTMAGMARWTLANNAMRDVDLARFLEAEIPRQPKPIAKALSDVVEAAQTFEVVRVRRDAVAAIDELKSKGPETKRNLQWWAQAGTTLISLGCIVAGATGHVEFGLPCVIGGPLSSAAGKYLIPDK
jgi:hypothetical protein